MFIDNLKTQLFSDYLKTNFFNQEVMVRQIAELEILELGNECRVLATELTDKGLENQQTSDVDLTTYKTLAKQFEFAKDLMGKVDPKNAYSVTWARVFILGFLPLQVARCLMDKDGNPLMPSADERRKFAVTCLQNKAVMQASQDLMTELNQFISGRDPKNAQPEALPS